MPEHFHHFALLKINFENQTSLVTISIRYHNNYASYFKNRLDFNKVKVAEYLKHCESHFQAAVVQCATVETKFDRYEN